MVGRELKKVPVGIKVYEGPYHIEMHWVAIIIGGEWVVHKQKMADSENELEKIMTFKLMRNKEKTRTSGSVGGGLNNLR